MKRSPLEVHLTALAEPVLKDLGFQLVWLDFNGGVLQILAENPETGTIGVDDCAKVSRALSAVLEEKDPIPAAYRLEVGSPGIERPLVRAEDFTRYAGREARIELDAPLNGQKRFKGVIKEEKNGIVTLTTDQGEKDLPLEDIAKARLVFSDDLIKKKKA